MTAAQALWKLMKDEALLLNVTGEERNRLFSGGIGERELGAIAQAAQLVRRSVRNEFDANTYLVQALK